jgi:hypothetical protein
MALIAQSDLEARVGRSLTTAEASDFAIINAANQAYVERMIGSYVEERTATTRYYDGGVQHLAIDPCTDITLVRYVDDDSNAEQTLYTSDYTTEPVNYTLKTMLRNRSKFVTSINNVAVTAKFSTYGDSNITAIIKDALLAAAEIEISNTDNVKRESIEGYSVEFSETQTKNALDKLKFLFPGV